MYKFFCKFSNHHFFAIHNAVYPKMSLLSAVMFYSSGNTWQKVNKIDQFLATSFVLLNISSYRCIISFTRALLAESCIRLRNLSGAKYLARPHFLKPSPYTNINTATQVLKSGKQTIGCHSHTTKYHCR